MSYEKITGTPNVIRFYYGIDAVFNEVSRISSYKAASIIKENGQADFERVSLSDDEKELMKRYMKTALLEVFSVMFKPLAGESIIHDSNFTPQGGSQIKASYADIKDNAKYREINLDLIDQKIEDAIIDFILYKWYTLKSVIDDAKIHFGEFTAGVASISKKSLALRQV